MTKVIRRSVGNCNIKTRWTDGRSYRKMNEIEKAKEKRKWECWIKLTGREEERETDDKAECRPGMGQLT